MLEELADECFMPLSYGGAIRSVAHARTILSIGYEKVVVNSAAFEDPDLVTRLADQFGSQAVIVSIDVRRNRDGTPTVWVRSGSVDTGKDPVEWAVESARRGAGGCN